MVNIISKPPIAPSGEPAAEVTAKNPQLHKLRVLERVVTALKSNPRPGGPGLIRRYGLENPDRAPPLPGITRAGSLIRDIYNLSDRPGIFNEVNAELGRIKEFVGVRPQALRNLIYPPKKD